MILSILLLIDKSKLLLELYYSVVWIGVFLRFLSDKSSDGYIRDLDDVSDYYRY